MLTVQTPITVEWGDCDPAGIVFYPRFLAWFDAASWNLFYEVGLSWDAMKKHYGAIGFPAVDAQATFLAPCRLKEQLVITSGVSEWNRKTFVISHSLYNGDVEAVRGREVRVWGLPHPEDPQRFKAGIIPPAVRRMLGG